jgi:hypothetical protein
MRKITAEDIELMMQENLKVLAGKGKNKKIIISPGFKIQHIKSGFKYTVQDILIQKGKPVIVAVGGRGAVINIHPNEFKQYEGL